MVFGGGSSFNSGDSGLGCEAGTRVVAIVSAGGETLALGPGVCESMAVRPEEQATRVVAKNAAAIGKCGAWNIIPS